MDPLRRYANSAAHDMKLCHRGTLVDGELKAGTPINKEPEVRPSPASQIQLP